MRILHQTALLLYIMVNADIALTVSSFITSAEDTSQCTLNFSWQPTPTDLFLYNTTLLRIRNLTWNIYLLFITTIWIFLGTKFHTLRCSMDIIYSFIAFFQFSVSPEITATSSLLEINMLHNITLFACSIFLLLAFVFFPLFEIYSMF